MVALATQRIEEEEEDIQEAEYEIASNLDTDDS